VVASVVGVVLAAGLMWLLTVLISNRTVTPKGPFEDTEFSVRIESVEDRVPFLLPDASPSRRRDIYIQHVEDEWLAFSAFAPGQDDRDCFLRWDGTAHFTDPCTDEQFPANGAGLTQYPTRVDDDRLYVDLND
jgi:hypothetical protein